jgi:hypothetical protein
VREKGIIVFWFVTFLDQGGKVIKVSTTLTSHAAVFGNTISVHIQKEIIKFRDLQKSDTVSLKMTK